MKSNQDRPTGWVCTDKQHDVVQSPERRLQDSNRSDASNKPTVGSAERVGQVGIAGGGGRSLEREQRGLGRTPETEPPRGQNHLTRV